MVRLTPDTAAYRSYRGIETYSECIRQNSELVLMNQILTLLFFAFAAAVNTNGIVTLQGGTFHPHALLRHIMQMAHFTTLVLSNQRVHFSEAEEKRLGDLWHAYISLFCDAGIIRHDDMAALRNVYQDSDLSTAGRLIDEFDVVELKQLKPFLDKLKGRGRRPTDPIPS